MMHGKSNTKKAELSLSTSGSTLKSVSTPSTRKFFKIFAYSYTSKDLHQAARSFLSRLVLGYLSSCRGTCRTQTEYVFISRLRTHLLSAVWRHRWWRWKLEFRSKIVVASCGPYRPSHTIFLALIHLAMFHIVFGWRWRWWWRY
jgi:hypothetical protein